MQTVLSIDATQSPPIGIVAEIDGNRIKVLERKELSFHPELPLDALLGSESAPEQPAEKAETPTDFSTPFTSALLIIPPLEYLSALLALPFGESRQLGKIVDSEIQDLVPFDTGEFVLQHRSVGSRKEGLFDIHVSAMPRRVVRNALALCQSRGIDPMVVTTPASMLQAAAVLSGNTQGAILYCYVSDRFCHLAFCIDGVTTIDRTIDRAAPYTNGAHGGGVTVESLLFRTKLEVAAIERKAERACDKIVFVDSLIETSLLEKALDRKVEILSVAELTRSASAPTGLAVLGAWLAEDSRAGSILTNFRVGEFAYRPPLKELVGALRALAPYLALCAGLAFAFLAGDYLLTNMEIDSLNNSVASQIRSVAGAIPLREGDEVKSLNAEIMKIEDELKDLGSPESYSPLESLAEVSSTMPNIPDVTINKINIKGNKIALEGCAPDYRAIETIENTLNKKSVYSNVKKQSVTCSSGKQNERGFRFELWMKE